MTSAADASHSSKALQRHFLKTFCVLTCVGLLSAVGGACTLSTQSPSVTICTPTANATVTSPVHIVAGSTDKARPVKVMQIYIDGVKKFQVSGNSVDTSLAMSVGKHRLTVQAYDGTIFFKSTIYITVSSSTGVSVTISPTSASVAENQTKQFTATVTGSSNTSVTWSVDGIAGGNSTVGTISTSGLYTAPGTAGSHTVKATSVADSTKSASAAVTVTAPAVSVSISPTSATVAENQTQQFTATVTGSSNTSVTWSVDGITGGNSTVGTISTTGLYTAPATAGSHTVTATSVADTTKSASAAVTVNASGVSVTISPTSATVVENQTQQFTATVTGSSNTSVTWSVDGIAGGNSTIGTISTSGLYTAPASTGSHTVTATSVADSTQSASAAVTVTAQVQSISVLTRSYNNMRTGANLNETILTPSNVNSAKFGKKFSLAVDGIVYGQPLYVPNLTIPNKGTHNVIYVATENDSVYAFDADGLTTTPLWHVNFTNPAAGITTVPCSELQSCGIAPNVGITATPVIDANSGTIYVEAMTKENGVHLHRLHALNILTGAAKVPSVVITATVAGTGAGNINGQITFDPTTQDSRPGLLLLNGVVYAMFASQPDLQPYHGWIIGYDAGTLARVSFFNDTPNGNGGGYWHSAGPAADSSGNIFAISSNGTAGAGGNDYGSSFVKLSANGGLTLMDYFTPFNAHTLNSTDIDLGSGGPLLLPDQSGTSHPHLLVSCGKEGRIYLVDRDNMGKFNSTSDQVVQEIPNAVGGGTSDRNFATPAYWNGNIYFAGNGDVLKMFSLNNGMLSTAPVSRGSFTFSFPGGAPVVSANGTSNGIVWVISVVTTGGNSGILHAYDATNLSTELYDSNKVSSRDALPSAVKFSQPLVVNGKVYVGTHSSIVVYGLL